MAGQVQMIYIDPPYGIRYGSNFQPFVNKRDVKDGKDEDLTQEPEMIKAFRDTWELGIHSYLAYLRDRLLLARELLSESGSVFLQISDENVHHVREVTDEILGVKNFVSLITFTKTTSATSERLAGVCDYLLVYARDIGKLKYRPLYREKEMFAEGGQAYTKVELPDGTRRSTTKEERLDPSTLPRGSKLFSLGDLTSQRPPGSFPVEFNGKTFTPKSNFWKTGPEGFKNLIKAKRVEEVGTVLRYVRYFDDFPVYAVNNIWTEFGGAPDKSYVVETNERVVQRCLLMTTDPGDLVLDITCGSGTTAFVAEEWGRRWITCDTSRVSLTLAKQRLMAAVFDYYELAHPHEGVASGFKYKTVPHITLKSIANNEPADQEVLYDQPFVDNSRARVTGPFTVEAVPAPVVKPLVEIKSDHPADQSIARSGETLRQAEWRDELLRSGIRGKRGQYILFSRVEPLPGTRWLHAEAETKPNDKGADRIKDPEGIYGKPQRVVISFGPEHARLEQKQVELAIEEAQTLVPKPKIIVFAAFQFDPEAAKDIDETDWPGVTLLKVQMNADLLTEDLKKKRASNESFWLIGQPDITAQKIKDGKDKGKYRVEVMGFDYYNTKTGAIESGGNEKIAMWMLDTDYDGRSLLPRQVFFPMAGENDGWSRLARNLKAEIDEELIEAYRGTVSLPFEPGKNKRVAVKNVDDRGIESLRILDIGG
jgi:adenine-specific DNA-methyltransferase